MAHEALNDGFLVYGTDETIQSARGKSIGETFTQIGRLAYQEMSCRDEDYEMAQKINSSVLNLKVRTLCPPQLLRVNKSNLKILINDMKYDVIKVDSDREKRYLFFYLQEVGIYEQNQSIDG